MTEKEKRILEGWAREAKEARAKREAFRKRDTARLLQMSDKAVAMACKAFFSAGVAEYTPWEEAEQEAIEAFEIIMHLTFEDWKC